MFNTKYNKINPRELMVGNFVGSQENPHKVHSIFSTHYTAYNKHNIEVNSAQYNLSGIFITNEILKKAGFLEIEGWWHHTRTCAFELNQKFPEMSGYWWAVRKGDGAIGYIIKSKFMYLHELQQLCYICGGFELEISW